MKFNAMTTRWTQRLTRYVVAITCTLALMPAPALLFAGALGGLAARRRKDDGSSKGGQDGSSSKDGGGQGSRDRQADRGDQNHHARDHTGRGQGDHRPGHDGNSHDGQHNGHAGLGRCAGPGTEPDAELLGQRFCTLSSRG